MLLYCLTALLFSTVSRLGRGATLLLFIREDASNVCTEGSKRLSWSMITRVIYSISTRGLYDLYSSVSSMYPQISFCNVAWFRPEKYYVPSSSVLKPRSSCPNTSIFFPL